MSGVLIFMAIPEPLMSILKGSERNLNPMNINGRLRPCGGVGYKFEVK